MKCCVMVLFLAVWCGATTINHDSLAVGTDTFSVYTNDTLRRMAQPKDSLVTSVVMDSVEAPTRSPLSVADTAGLDRGDGRPESIGKIKLIKRKYNYRQQVRFAIGMMAFIALAMMSSQTWNPK